MSLNYSDHRLTPLFRDMDEALRQAKAAPTKCSTAAPAEENGAATDPWSVGFALIARRKAAAEHELLVIRQVLACCDAKASLACSDVDGASLAIRIRDYVNDVAQRVVFRKDDIPAADQTDFEREEWRELRAEWRRLRLWRKKLCDTRHVSVVLRGQTAASPVEMRRLREVLLKLSAIFRWFASEDYQREERVRLMYGGGYLRERLETLREDCAAYFDPITPAHADTPPGKERRA